MSFGRGKWQPQKKETLQKEYGSDFLELFLAMQLI